MADWREIQKLNFTSLEKLIQFLELDSESQKVLLGQPRFPLNLPLRLAEKIQKNSLDDPILRQFVPLREELDKQEGFSRDPVADKTFRKGRKLLQKYESRALLVLTGSCAMNCRFCFRQNFDYEKEQYGCEEELAHIAQDTSLKEVILSGGDPLSLSNAALQRVISFLETCTHVKRLRFHTRFPVGIPERIDEAFLNMLATSRLQTWFIIHTNHAQEIDNDVLASLRAIQKSGATVQSQTVLLKGVNDSVEALQALFERLIDNGIAPYYLHQLDRVEGAAHFEVTESDGIAMLKEIATKLSGYGLPRYVKEIAGEKGKTALY